MNISVGDPSKRVPLVLFQRRRFHSFCEYFERDNAFARERTLFAVSESHGVLAFQRERSADSMAAGRKWQLVMN